MKKKQHKGIEHDRVLFHMYWLIQNFFLINSWAEAWMKWGHTLYRCLGRSASGRRKKKGENLKILGWEYTCSFKEAIGSFMWEK